MVRRYNVEGPKNYLIAAVIMLVLCAWFVWDGWFPREAVLGDHPDMSDHFYLFNKSVAILLAVGVVVCAYIHVVVK